MTTIYEKWDKQTDLDGLYEDIDNASKNKNEYEEVPHGTYDVFIEKMELKETKKGDPMVSIWFKILNGKFENSIIFYNQVITKGVQIHIANELLRSLETSVNVEFKSYSQYAALLNDILEACDEEDLTFTLKYGKNKSGYNTYEILDIFVND